MKQLPTGTGANKKVKDYYLKDVMQFVRPFLKSKRQTGNLPSPEEETASQNLDEEDNSNPTADTELHLNHPEEPFQTNEASSSSTENAEKRTSGIALQILPG